MVVKVKSVPERAMSCGRVDHEDNHKVKQYDEGKRYRDA